MCSALQDPAASCSATVSVPVHRGHPLSPGDGVLSTGECSICIKVPSVSPMDEVLSLALISFVSGASSVKKMYYFIAKNDFLLHKLIGI